ncbi:MAG TPA: hypothetical protein VGX45_09630, partial [Solirubrobacteraceae bacterium]|nr:hypothetical protein [Solirubrobacteraceae bacterium]
LVSVDDPPSFPSFAPEQRWADADVEHGAELLRDVFTERDRARAVGDALAGVVRDRYRPAAVAAKFRSAVEQHRFGARNRGAAATAPAR